MKNANFVALYACFAIAATFVNLMVQRIWLAIATDAFALPIAIGLGTMVGLLFKYVLDRKWIFVDPTPVSAQTFRQFVLYSVMGISTTAIFWACEFAFWHVWRTDAMRELGAVLGLGVGYIAKYHLDKRFVFAHPSRGLA